MAQKEINSCSPNQLKICWHDDPQTLSVLNRHPEAFSLRSGEWFPYYLSDAEQMMTPLTRRIKRIQVSFSVNGEATWRELSLD